jgi:hypothetical protein
MRRMFREDTAERVRGVLFRTKSCSAPYCASLRLSRSRTSIPRRSLILPCTLIRQVLKPACVSALKRIFKLCDTNKDGILDVSELNEFQVGFAPSF